MIAAVEQLPPQSAYYEQIAVTRLTVDEQFELAERMHAGDAEARNVLIQSQLPWLLKYTRDWMRIKNLPGDLLPEYVAEVNLRWCVAVEKFDPTRGQISTFATTVAHSKLLQLNKRISLQKRCEHATVNMSSLMVDDQPFLLADESPDAGELFDTANDVRRVQLALRQLPERERDIVTRRMDGETLEEVGNALGVTRERIRQIETRAHHKLRAILVRRAKP